MALWPEWLCRSHRHPGCPGGDGAGERAAQGAQLSLGPQPWASPGEDTSLGVPRPAPGFGPQT